MPSLPALNASYEKGFISQELLKSDKKVKFNKDLIWPSETPALGETPLERTRDNFKPKKTNSQITNYDVPVRIVSKTPIA